MRNAFRMRLDRLCRSNDRLQWRTRLDYYISFIFSEKRQTFVGFILACHSIAFIKV